MARGILSAEEGRPSALRVAGSVDPSIDGLDFHMPSGFKPADTVESIVSSLKCYGDSRQENAKEVLIKNLSSCFIDPLVSVGQAAGKFYHTPISTSYLLAAGDDTCVLKLVDLAPFWQIFDDMAQMGVQLDIEWVRINKRFRNEAFLHRRCSDINPFSTPRLYAAGIEESTCYGYMLMAYAQGPDLFRHMKVEHDPKVVLEHILATVDHVVRMHDNGIVHRDLKPFHIRMGGGTNIIDYGFAVDLHRAGGIAYNDRTEAAVGTPHYMAPESCRTKKVTPALDVYSLGIILFQTATGELPFEYFSNPKVMCKEKEREIENFSTKSGYPSRLKRVIRKCTHPEPDKRISAAELSEYLGKIVKRM